MLIQTARNEQNQRVTLFKTEKLGTALYTITKHNEDGTINEKVNHRYEDVALYLFKKMAGQIPCQD